MILKIMKGSPKEITLYDCRSAHVCLQGAVVDIILKNGETEILSIKSGSNVFILNDEGTTIETFRFFD